MGTKRKAAQKVAMFHLKKIEEMMFLAKFLKQLRIHTSLQSFESAGAVPLFPHGLCDFQAK